MAIRTSGAACVLGCLLAGCSGEKKQDKPVEPAKKLNKAPDRFHVKLNTTKGDVIIESTREWAPRGADRFYELVTNGFFDQSRFFRVRPKFAVQFGISKDPKMNELWQQLQIPDDPVTQSNKRGYVSFAMRGPSTRTTQVFINLRDNSSLDSKGFAPFGRIVEGLDNIERLYSAYGEVASLGGSGPDTAKLQMMGDEYAQRSFPRLDTINSAKVIDYKPTAQ